MERLHALIAFAAFLVSLRGGLNLLKLYGLGKFTSSPAFVPEHCPGFLHPVQPFQQPNITNLEYDAQHLLQWLKGQAGVVIEGSVGFFGELRGLQVCYWHFSVLLVGGRTHQDNESSKPVSWLCNALQRSRASDLCITSAANSPGLLRATNYVLPLVLFISYVLPDASVPA